MIAVAALCAAVVAGAACRGAARRGEAAHDRHADDLRAYNAAVSTASITLSLRAKIRGEELKSRGAVSYRADGEQLAFTLWGSIPGETMAELTMTSNRARLSLPLTGRRLPETAIASGVAEAVGAEVPLAFFRDLLIGRYPVFDGPAIADRFDAFRVDDTASGRREVVTLDEYSFDVRRIALHSGGREVLVAEYESYGAPIFAGSPLRAPRSFRIHLPRSKFMISVDFETASYGAP